MSCHSNKEELSQRKNQREGKVRTNEGKEREDAIFLKETHPLLLCLLFWASFSLASVLLSVFLYFIWTRSTASLGLSVGVQQSLNSRFLSLYECITFSRFEKKILSSVFISSLQDFCRKTCSLSESLSRQASQNKSSCRRHSLSLLLPFVLGDDSRRLLLFSCKDFSLYSKISKKHRITMRKRVSFLQEFFLSWCSCWTNTSIKGKHYICSSIFSSRIVSRFYRNQHHVVLCMTLTASSSCSVHGMKKKKDLHPHPSTDCLNEGRDAAAASRVALFPSTPCFADTRRDQDKKKCEETTKITSLPCPSSSYSSCVHREHFSSSSCLCSSKTRNSSREQELKRDRVLLFIWLRVPSQTSLISSLSFSLHLSLRVFNS